MTESPCCSSDADPAIAERLNLGCHCIAVDRSALEASLAERLGDAQLGASLRETHRNLFSSSPVFVAAAHLRAMGQVVDALERLATLPAFAAAVEERLRAVGLHPPADRTPALLSYDFHLAVDGPKLIEVNTNPGGVLLALHLRSAQRACCPEVAAHEQVLASRWEVEETLVEMARAALPSGSANGDDAPHLAIVDEEPERQFLHPELVLYRKLFEMHDIDARILDVADLRWEDEALHAGAWRIDGVYNRFTDFELAEPGSSALRAAWQSGQVSLTPDPRAWASFADKRNLVLASDAAALEDLGLEPEHRETLARCVPPAHLLDESTAAQLWERRKSLFFKPVSGHGSRGAYDGRKISRRKFEEILSQRTVAQERVPPTERALLLDDVERRLKLDVRCVTWNGRILLLLGRLYRGQATNMRTEGGGLATVFVA